MSIEADDLRILGHVEHACSQIGVEWMLVGALARDIHLIEIAGIVPSRATNDVDIAVAVQSWETFAALKESLISSRTFVSSNNAQRLLGVDDLKGRQLDIVPFGERILDASSLIRWPGGREGEKATPPWRLCALPAAGRREPLSRQRHRPIALVRIPTGGSVVG